MTRHFHFPFLIFLALTSSAVAGPITYTGSTSAVFTDPIGGQSKGAGTSQFEFGGPNGATLSFNQTISHFTATNGVPFQLGSVMVTSGSPVNAPSEVTFAVTLNFKTPTGLGKETFDFATGIQANNRDSSGEFSVLFNVGGKSSVTANGEQYTLELVGLTNTSTWGSTVYNSLTGCPTNSCGLYIWGELTMQPAPPQVPEPSGLLLGAIGIGAIALRRIRVKRRALR